MLRVLVIPGTTQIAHEIRSAIELEKGISVFGAGANLNDVSIKNFTHYEYLSAEWQSDTLENIKNIVEKFNIDLVFPAHDQWIFNLSGFTTIGKARIICHPQKAINICSFKLETYKYFSGKIPVPDTFRIEDDLKTFPVVIKPNRGQGGVGFKIVSNGEELRLEIENLSINNDLKNYICTSFLSGAEFTVDCFSAVDSKVIFAKGRLRNQTHKGLAVVTEDYNLNVFYEYAQVISSELNLCGAWFFQVKNDSLGVPTLLEIGLRPAGASAIRRVQGVNLPLMSIHQTLGKEVIALNHDIKSVVTRLSIPTTYHHFSFECVYVDFDDTLIVEGKVNSNLIDFLHSCKAQNVQISLVTRSKVDLEKLVMEMNIKSLFSELIYVPNGVKKSSKILTTKKFIFIDDSFSERLDVFNVFSNQALTVDQSAFSMKWLISKPNN